MIMARELVPTKPGEKVEAAQPGDLDYDEQAIAPVAVAVAPEPAPEPVKADPGPTTSPASKAPATHPLTTPVASREGNLFAPVHGFITICKICATEKEHRLSNASKVPGICDQPGCRGPLLLTAEVP